MLYKVVLMNGRRIYKEEGSKLVCYDPETISYKLVDMEEAEGRLVQYEKNIETDNSVCEVNGTKLTFDIGYAIGATLTRMFRYEPENSEAIFCYRDAETQDRVFAILRGISDKRQRIRQALRLSRRDEYWFKSRVKSKKFFDIVKHLKLRQRQAGDPWWMKVAPKEFKRGMFCGLFDSRAEIFFQDRSKHGKKPCFICRIDTAERTVHGLAAQICSGVDVEYCESFSCFAGENRNRVVFRLWSVKENPGLFEGMSRPILADGMTRILESENMTRKSGDIAPAFPGINKLQRQMDPSAKGGSKHRLVNGARKNTTRWRAEEFIEKYNVKKSEDPKLRRWAELFKPDHRWSVVKSVEAHYTARY